MENETFNSYTYTTDSNQSEKKLDLKKWLGLGIIILLISGIGVGVFLSGNKQTIKSEASKASSITIESPKRGEKVAQDVTIKARLDTQVAEKQLHGVLKIDNIDPQTLSILRVDPKTVVLTLDLNTRKYTQGVHKLEFFVYDLTSGKPTPIGQGQSEINIEN